MNATETGDATKLRVDRTEQLYAMTRSHPSNGASIMPPLFIVLEGIDGSGTTTQLDRLAQHLRERGRPALATREPSEGPVGRLLREALLGQHRDTRGAPIDGRAMALLFAADRRDHLVREIEPALAAGMDVVADRYLLSSLAYQAVEADRLWVQRLAEGVRVPDLTLILDLPTAVAAERRRRAGRVDERYDADATLIRVAENYRRLAAAPSRELAALPGDELALGPVVLLDATDTVDAVARVIAAEVDRLLDEPAARRESSR
jgi:dTMP kinase